MPSVHSLVLDAAPLITQTYAELGDKAARFYTTPGVRAELRDENTRRQLLLWGDRLEVRAPSAAGMAKTVEMAKRLGDYGVLSANDLGIIALAWDVLQEGVDEVEVEKTEVEKTEVEKTEAEKVVVDVAPKTSSSPWAAVLAKSAPVVEAKKEVKKEVAAPFVVAGPKKRNRRGGKKQREKRDAREVEEEAKPEAETGAKAKPDAEIEAEAKPEVETKPETETTAEAETSDLHESESESESESDSEWITPDNLAQMILKDLPITDSAEAPAMPCALATNDFACQNVSLQLHIPLMNSRSGLRILRVRLYMLRCHACFKLTAMPKDGRPRHFCPLCGGATLLRCSVLVDAAGTVTPHLKANFEWHRKGDRYSIASPLSKASQKRAGNAGFKHKDRDAVLLREDQKEYVQALKDDVWERHQAEKAMEEWVGGGSADNFVSPFGGRAGGRGVKVGRGRGANQSKRK